MIKQQQNHIERDGILYRIRIDPLNKAIRDETGQQLIFHGVNVVYKVKPYIPDMNEFHSEESLTENEIKDLSELGFNLVRLGVSWESVETSPNQFNQTYLNQIEILINRLAKYGIYTMIDVHQDVAAKFICGHGFPNFYSKEIGQGAKCKNNLKGQIIKYLTKQFGICENINNYGYKTDEDGNPLPSECLKVPFVKYYGLAESLKIFDALYTNKQQFRDKFIRFWDVLVSKFARNSNVMGFDPLNEPFISDFIEDVSLTMPKRFDRDRLLPLYSEMYRVMQKYNKDTILHFEVAPVPNIIGTMGGIVNNAGYDRLPGQDNQTDFQINHVMHDHFYCCQIDYDMCNSKDSQGEPKDDIKSESICDDFHRRRINKRTQDAHRLQIPLMITEFGACYNSQVCVREINQVLDQCERTLCGGWAYWQLKNYKDTTTVGMKGSQGFYDSDGMLQIPKIKALSRPYQRKTQGTLLKSRFNVEDKVFQSSFILDQNLKNATTEIFINKFIWYQNRRDGINGNRGFIMYVKDESNNHVFPQIEYLDDNNLIQLRFNKYYHNNQIIDIQIKPYNTISDVYQSVQQMQ